MIGSILPLIHKYQERLKPLELTEAMIVTPGERVIERSMRRKLSCAAHSRAEARRLQNMRLKMAGSAQ